MPITADARRSAHWPLGLALFLAAALPLLISTPLRPDVAILSVILGVTLLAASVVDWRSFILPDVLTLPLIAAGALATFWLGAGSIVWSAASAAIGYGALWAADQAYLAVRGRHGLGMGDAKLLAAAGAWLGAESLPTVVLWATGLALCAALVAVASGRRLAAKTRVPFGPALAMGFWLTWLYGALA